MPPCSRTAKALALASATASIMLAFCACRCLSYGFVSPFGSSGVNSAPSSVFSGIPESGSLGTTTTTTTCRSSSSSSSSSSSGNSGSPALPSINTPWRAPWTTAPAGALSAPWNGALQAPRGGGGLSGAPWNGALSSSWRSKSSGGSGSALHMSSGDEGEEYPSDCEGENPMPERDSSNDAAMRESIKMEILNIAAVSDRGQVATLDEKDIVSDLVYQLETMNPNPVTNSGQLQGTWDLLYSDVEPFRSSPFFMAIGELFGEQKERAETLFAAHRAATANGEIGRVRQTITEDSLTSEIDLRVGIMSGMSLALKGTVVTTSSITPSGNNAFNVAVKDTSVKNNNILKFIDGSLPALPIASLYNRVRGSVPETKLSTVYLDDSFRVSRTPDNHFFIYTKGY